MYTSRSSALYFSPLVFSLMNPLAPTSIADTDVFKWTRKEVMSPTRYMDPDPMLTLIFKLVQYIEETRDAAVARSKEQKSRRDDVIIEVVSKILNICM